MRKKPAIGQRGADGDWMEERDGLDKKTAIGQRGADGDWTEERDGLGKKTETPAEIRVHEAGDKGFII